MSQSEPSTVAAPVVKVVSAWAAVGISSWADVQAMAGAIAALLAAFYSLLLIGEWWWKKFWRPMAEDRGWIKRKPAAMTESEWAALRPGGK